MVHVGCNVCRWTGLGEWPISQVLVLRHLVRISIMQRLISCVVVGYVPVHTT